MKDKTVVVFQERIQSWINADYITARDMLPAMQTFCNERFPVWYFYDRDEDETYSLDLNDHRTRYGLLPHSIKFETEEDAMIFILAFN